MDLASGDELKEEREHPVNENKSALEVTPDPQDKAETQSGDGGRLRDMRITYGAWKPIIGTPCPASSVA
jgi:hypothetical protein